MKYNKFRDTFTQYPYFRSNIFESKFDNPQLIRRQMTDWLKKGNVIKLKGGLYTLNDKDRTSHLNPYTIAQAICPSSYISLETALSYYQMIPEKIVSITSITTKKTQTYENKYGTFVYHHIHQNGFTGFIKKTDKFGYSYWIATPEKALLDFLYFRTMGLRKFSPDIFEESFRLQNLNIIDLNKCEQLLNKMAQQKLNKLFKAFKEYYHA